MNRKSEKNTEVIKPYRLVLVAVVPFILLGLIFLLLYKKPLYIVRSTPLQANSDLVLSAYNDKSSKGNSEINMDVSDSGKISYRYILKEGFTFPYVGILFSKPDSSLFDISSYGSLKIKIKASAGTRVPLTITSEIRDYSKLADHLSFRNSQYVLTVSDRESEIIFPFRKLETPDWWYSANNKTEKDLDAPDFSKVKTVQLGNCINIKKEKEDEITISEMSLHVDFFPFYIASSVFLSAYFGLVFLFLYRKKKSRKTEINFQYEKIDTINHLDKEEEIVFNFITSHYSNPELTIIDVQTAVGLHERKISAIIKNKTELNFKQFLNKLRIAEAKRLLSTSDLQISKIAFKVGYGNASHFNRVFKSSENCSPNDFRKEHSTPND